MNYKIGEVSKKLGISVEMIRYYEKKNIMNPKRDNESQYRLYDIWDIFYLLDCIRYRKLNFSIKEAFYTIHKGSIDHLIDRLDQEITRSENLINYQKLLIQYMKNYQNDIKIAYNNLGNYWIQKSPPMYYFYYIESEGDNYSEFNEPEDLFAEWIKFAPFLYGYMHINLDDYFKNFSNAKWDIAIEVSVADMLQVPINASVHISPEQFYMVSVVDAGDIGQLSLKMLNPVFEKVKNSKYQIMGDALCRMILCTHENGHLRRYLQIQVPIK